MTQRASSALARKQANRSCFNKYWIIGVGIAINHVIAVFIFLYYRDVSWSLVAGAIAAGFFNMLGITAGYHRLWSHNSFKASLPLRYFLSIIGTMSWQGSIHWWVLRHRMHHRFTDTKFDPYDSTRGFWFSHYGWLFEKPRFYERTSIIDMSDLNRDPVVQWNKKYTPHLVIILGLLLPAFLGYLLGDALGGFLWIGVIGRIISWNGIFCVNSWAHTFGDRPFNGSSSATNSFIGAFISNGEGNHSFHHEFPYDYRHGIKWYEYDPTKWSIWLWSKMRLATHLQRVPGHLVKQSELQTTLTQAQEAVDIVRKRLTVHMETDGHPADASDYVLPTEPSLHALPVTTLEHVRANFESFKLNVQSNVSSSTAQAVPDHEIDAVTWVQIGDRLCDVTLFLQHHPGGKALLKANHLKDASASFFGGRNIHTRAARDMVRRMSVAIIKDKGDDDSSSTSSQSSNGAPESLLRSRSAM